MAFTGIRSGVIQGTIRLVILHATRNNAGRIVGVGLTVPGMGEISFAHILDAPGSVASRLETLRAAACPMSAVRVRRAEQVGAPHEYTDTDSI